MVAIVLAGLAALEVMVAFLGLELWLRSRRVDRALDDQAQVISAINVLVINHERELEELRARGQQTRVDVVRPQAEGPGSAEIMTRLGGLEAEMLAVKALVAEFPAALVRELKPRARQEPEPAEVTIVSRVAAVEPDDQAETRPISAKDLRIAMREQAEQRVG